VRAEPPLPRNITPTARTGEPEVFINYGHDDGIAPTRKTNERKVFIVHGHDEGPREAVARFLERIDFQVVILHEQVNKGRTT
jgi:predicted nucleotide-binding protein